MLHFQCYQKEMTQHLNHIAIAYCRDFSFSVFFRRKKNHFTFYPRLPFPLPLRQSKTMLHINFYYIKIFYTLLTSFKLSFIFVFQCKIDRDRNSLRIQCNVAIHHSFLTRGKISIFVQKIYLYKGTGQQGQERRDRAAGTGMQGQGRRGTGLQ